MIRLRFLAARTILVAVAIGAIAACSSGPSPSGSGAGPAGSGAAPGSTAGAGSSAGVGQPGEIVVGPGELTQLEPAAGLDSLTSYRARLTKTFNGTVAGQLREWSVIAELVHVDDPLANSLSVETTGDPPESPGQIFERGGVLYAIPVGLDCVATAEGTADVVRSRAELATMLPGVIGAEKVDASSVDGTSVEHYRFDERALGLAGLATATGELWVATAGYIVRYALTIRGDAAYFGTDSSGTATWEYVLGDVNAPISVDVPAACPGGRVDAPLLEDASDVSSAPGVLTYVTARDIKGVIAFYEGKAKDLGWSRTGDPLSNKELGVLEYSSAEGAVTVFVSSAGGTTTVRILVDPGAGG